MIKQHILTLFVLLFFTQAGIAQSTDTFTDSRDGQTYKTFSFKDASTHTTDSEWSMLVIKFGGTDKAGEALKSVKSWTEDGNGTNSSGFNGLPAGIRRNNLYEVMNVMGFWWTSTLTGEEGKAWGWNFSYGGPGEKPLKTKAFRFPSSVSYAESVRCVRD